MSSISAVTGTAEAVTTTVCFAKRDGCAGPARIVGPMQHATAGATRGADLLGNGRVQLCEAAIEGGIGKEGVAH